MAVMQGAYGLARARLEEVLAGEAAGDHWLAAHAWRHLGDVAVFEQNLAAATVLYQRSLAQYRELGDRGRAANAVRCLGHVALAQGELATAAAHYEESLTLAEAVGHRPNMALSLAGLAGVTVAAGQADAAARLLGAADALRAASHGQLPAADAAAYARTRAALENALGPETFARLYVEGGAQSETEVVTTEAVRAVLLVGRRPADEAGAGGTSMDQRTNRD